MSEVNGAFLINKPKGITSFDVVAQVRSALGIKKVGHSGTLDPTVDGLIIVVVGSATKLIERLQNHRKRYAGQITLGFSTETEDLEGQVVQQVEISEQISSDKIDSGMETLTGNITQYPPKYSAVKVNGKKLYEYARAGEQVEIPSRQVTVYSFTRSDEPVLNASNQTESFHFNAEVSSGTYIRTLASDLGKSIDVPATMTALTRLSADGFDLDDSLTLKETIEKINDGKTDEIIVSIDELISEIRKYPMSTDEWEKVKNGSPMYFNSKVVELALVYEDQIKAVYKFDGELFRPEIMFSNH
jgi:tRNA pseudouridine55 synthase